jgi:membrane protease YdiL (CAAX protease family)
MRLQAASARAVKELAGYKRELLFWILLLLAVRALGSVRPSRQFAGLIETAVFLVVAVSSAGKLGSLGLEFADWNPVSPCVAAACVAAGLFAGSMVILVAKLSHQPVGTGTGWNKAVLAVVLGPVLEEVIFRGYLLNAALLLARRLSVPKSGASSVLGVALLFSIAHRTTAGTTALQLCCIVFTGCLYGHLRLRYRSTLAAALAHGSYNLALYLSYWFGNFH